MRSLMVSLLVLCVFVHSQDSSAQETKSKVPDVLNFKMKALNGKEIDLGQFKGKVILFVNVASECGLTPQYQGLQKLHKDYANQGLVVIGIPSNDFGRQEPGSDEEIAKFCQTNYGVEFPMLAKVQVLGEGQCGLYKHLTSKDTNPKFSGPIRWNFDKFLIGKTGEIVARFEPATDPLSDDVVQTIRKELEK